MTAIALTALRGNRVTTHIQPDESVSLSTYAHLPPPLPTARIEAVLGTTLFRTAEPYSFSMPDGRAFTIPSGFVTDLASVPRVFWRIIAPHELGVESPLIHDWLLEHGAEHGVTRVEADDVFGAVLQRQRIDPVKARRALKAVKLWTTIELRAQRVFTTKSSPRAALGVAWSAAPVAALALGPGRITLILEAVRVAIHIWRQYKDHQRAKAEEGLGIAASSGGFLARLFGRLFPRPAPVVPPTFPEPTDTSDAVALWKSATVLPDWAGRVKAQVGAIRKAQDRYEEIERRTGVPWQIIAVIHHLECSGSFGLHLHNGDPLSARTKRVPAGRPNVGNPPFSWEESAVDAVMMKSWHTVGRTNWTLARTLDLLERYNGLGYRRMGRVSPYLWSGTQLYRKGKYVRDGVFDPEAISKQVGVVPLLKALGFHE